MKKLTVVLSVVFLSLTLVIPTYAGRIKELLMDAEDMIYAEMRSRGYYHVEIEELKISSNERGIIVGASVMAMDNKMRRSSRYACEVDFEGPVGQLEPAGVNCY